MKKKSFLCDSKIEKFPHRCSKVTFLKLVFLKMKF